MAQSYQRMGFPAMETAVLLYWGAGVRLRSQVSKGSHESYKFGNHWAKARLNLEELV